MEQTKALVKTITEGIQEKKGTDIVVADLTKIEGTICKYFIICQGNSPTQVEAIAESIGDFARERLKEKPTHVVGLENANGWPWTIPMSWSISSCPMSGPITTSNICGKMPD